jgi:hypothetical protein
MELKIDFDEASLRESALRATLLKGAVAHIVSSVTPEAMAVFMEKVLADALRGIAGYDVQQAVRPHVKEIVDAYLAAPETRSRLEQAVRQGIDASINGLPEEVKKAVTAMAAENFRRALQSKLNY